MADGTTVCPGCGKAAAGATASTATAGGGLQDNVAGMLAYFTIVPAILFLLLEPYNKNKFIRFHAFQCLFLAAGIFVLNIVLNFVPILGLIASMFVGLACFILWILLVVKAYQGQKFKVPFIGDLAEQQA
ncbi:MAG TPA: DUF4870 domain-containing protein [Terriglobales bacterium]|nr:DUF4870 domain-containing protein [Terriglobales bacterium]